MECLHDFKLSPFENRRPCVARHVNNKMNMIPFSIMMMIVTRRLEVPILPTQFARYNPNTDSQSKTTMFKS
jgi:hypothetical protein